MSVFELQTGETISAFDGDFQPETPSAVQPLDGFDTESGPNRFTIWIPSETVAVNMGNAVLGTDFGLENPAGTPPLIDRGFVVQTDNHIHFHAFGFPTQTLSSGTATPTTGGPDAEPSFVNPEIEATERTVLRLGTPPSVVRADSAASSYGSKKMNALSTPTLIGSAYAPPYNDWDGYAMITEGGSYQESWGNNLIVSGNADVRIGGQRSVIVGSPGDVHIFAYGDHVESVVSNESVDTDLQGMGHYATETVPWQILDVTMDAAALAEGAVGLYMSLAHAQYARPSAIGEPGWKAFGHGTTGENISDAMSFVGTLVSPAFGIVTAYMDLKKLISPSTTPGSNVTLFANASVSLYGKVGATMHADLSSSVSGAVAASLSSGVSTTVSSLIAASVSGLTASMSGLLSVGMSSSNGSATVTGKDSAQLSSWGQIFVTGNQDVQVNSVESSVYVHGNKGFYVGCGAPVGKPVTTSFPFMGATTGMDYSNNPQAPADPPAGTSQRVPFPGYGIVGDPTKGIQIGKVQYAHVFTGPTPDATNQIQITDDQIAITHKAVSLTLDDTGAKVSGKRILLGDS
jgi:hypothetical protein